LYLLLSATFLYAQPYYFKHYQVENGLSNNTVFCSVQDSKGFLWFGTKDGLNRFDGYTFKTFRNDPANPKSIDNDLIYCLHSDHDAQLWVGTNKGVFSYNPVNESFSLLKLTKQMSVHQIQSDDEGNLWIIAASRLFRYNKSKRQLYAFEERAPFDASSVNITSDHGIWVCTNRGTIEKYDEKSNTFKSYYVLNKQDFGGNEIVSSFKETADHQFLIGTNTQGLKLFNPQTGKRKDLVTLNDDKSHIFVRDITQRSEHEYWVGTESGIYIYNHLTGKIIHLKKQYDNNYSLSDNAVYSLCTDREGGVWSTTYFGGINYYAKQYAIFTKYFPMQQSNSISGSAVREIQKDNDGNLWIGTEDAGLNKLDAKTGLFTTYLPDGDHNSIAYSNVHGLMADGDKLWVGTFEHGLDLMDIHSGKVIKHYTAGTLSGLRSNFIIAFYKTRAGIMMLATTNGVYSYDPKRDRFVPVDGLPFTFYNLLLEDERGFIWAGSFNEGIFRFKPGQKGFKNFSHSEYDQKSLSHNTINSIFQDSRKNIWITTDGGGLCLYNKGNATFKRYTLKDGLPSNFLFRIEEDADHSLWISSTRGLIHFDPAMGTFKTYTRADGLLTDQFNYSSSFKDPLSGRLYFGSVKGLISFQPEDLRTKNYIAPVFLTNFQIDNNDNPGTKNNYPLKKSVLYTDTIVLKYSQSSFSINFAALSFFSPEMTSYAYKMTGLYKDWEYLKTNRKVYFTKLIPGNYVFEAKALINGSSEWSKENARIVIRVLPPFYLSPLAFFFYLLFLLIIVVYLILRYHHRIARKNKRRMEVFEHEKEKEIYQAKIEFFTLVSHEIRTPLTLIKGPMEKLIGQAHEMPAMEKNLKIMNRNTDRLLNLTNQLLDFRKTEINGFSLNFIKANISEIIQDISMNFMAAAEQKKLNLQVNLPAEPLYAYVDIEAIHKIISCLIDNALKYGKAKIRIHLGPDQENEDHFQIRIMNDGQLIPVPLYEKVFEPFFRTKEAEIKPGTGIGLSISRSLSELHKGSLFMEKNTLDFNIFVVTLPVHQLIEFNLNEKWKKH